MLQRPHFDDSSVPSAPCDVVDYNDVPVANERRFARTSHSPAQQRDHCDHFKVSPLFFLTPRFARPTGMQWPTSRKIEASTQSRLGCCCSCCFCSTFIPASTGFGSKNIALSWPFGASALHPSSLAELRTPHWKLSSRAFVHLKIRSFLKLKDNVERKCENERGS